MWKSETIIILLRYVIIIFSALQHLFWVKGAELSSIKALPQFLKQYVLSALRKNKVSVLCECMFDLVLFISAYMEEYVL